LSIADVGIAIGSGSTFLLMTRILLPLVFIIDLPGDIAISSASFVLLSSHLRCLFTLRDLSRKVLNRIKFNFVSVLNPDNNSVLICNHLCPIKFWALFYNIVALPIAAGVLYPFGRARLDPVWASLAMALS
jgi:Cu+-exporting ATPase